MAGDDATALPGPPPMPAGEVGTIVLHGPNVFAGYLVRGESGTELRADGKVRDGWLDTGDLGAVDDDGFIALAGRAKDLIIRGGTTSIPPRSRTRCSRIRPSRLLLRSADPTSTSGELPVAFVVLAEGAGVPVAELAARRPTASPSRPRRPGTSRS